MAEADGEISSAEMKKITEISKKLKISSSQLNDLIKNNYKKSKESILVEDNIDDIVDELDD